MKDKIYTIALSDAFAAGGICPFCTVASELESNLIEQTLGASMMEPDIREQTNKYGFCRHHYDMLKMGQKVLPLALIIQSHISHNVTELYKCSTEIKKGLFGKEKTDYRQMLITLSESLKNHDNCCYICHRIDTGMEKCIDTAVYMWRTEPDFRQTVKSSEGFCVKHASMLAEYAAKRLSERELEDFLNIFTELQNRKINELYEDISTFVNSFNYLSNEPLTEKVKDSVDSCIKMV